MAGHRFVGRFGRFWDWSHDGGIVRAKNNQGAHPGLDMVPVARARLDLTDETVHQTLVTALADRWEQFVGKAPIIEF